MTLLYGCCVGSWDKFQQYVLPRIGASPVIAVGNQTGIADAYNTILDAAQGSNATDGLVLLHDDLEITDPRHVEKFQEILVKPDVAIVGVAGGRGVSGLDWWNCETVGHQQTDTRILEFGPRSGDVESLEGSILAFSPWSINTLRFDPAYEGFHGYDEISMQALRHGKRVVVADVDTWHHTELGFRSESSAHLWHMANSRFQEKWLRR